MRLTMPPLRQTARPADGRVKCVVYGMVCVRRRLRARGDVDRRQREQSQLAGQLPEPQELRLALHRHQRAPRQTGRSTATISRGITRDLQFSS